MNQYSVLSVYLPSACRFIFAFLHVHNFFKFRNHTLLRNMFSVIRYLSLYSWASLR